MRTRNLRASLTAASLLLVFGACGGNKAASETSTSQVTTDSTLAQTQTAAPGDTTAHQHHSVLGGALVGAATGHVLGHHALAGAAAGALVQHERNKR
jgi:hypothetical protein